MGSPSNGDMPVEIILEILLRLPVKSLCQFKCVCRHWYTLIENPTFIKQHFGHENNQERLLIRHYKHNKFPNAFVLYVDEMCSGYEEPDHLQMPDTVVELMGPLNGVFCMVGHSGKIALLNPAMRQFKPLPLHLDVPPFLSVCDFLVAFGLDPLSGYYKVVSTQSLWDEERNDDLLHPLVSIYNSGSDSWRQVQDWDSTKSVLSTKRSVCNTFLSGVYYWVMGLNGGGVAILAFHMSSENFQEIQVPSCIKYKEAELDLFLYGGSIALLSYDYLGKTDKCVHVWTMKNEGCWIKSFTVGPIQDIRRPLCFWKNNYLLLETDSPPLTLYNVSTGKMKTVESGREFYVRPPLYWVFSYKESLVSLKREGGNCKLWDTSSDFVKDFFK